MKKSILFLSTLLAMLGCQSNKSNENADVPMKKQLIAYYSQTGVTDKVAHEFARILDADCVQFDIDHPYTGTFEETVERCKIEMEENTLYKLTGFDVDLSNYDTIFLGYSVWFGTYARPVMSLLQEQNFDGKIIVPFCTFGSGGLVESTEFLKAALPNSTILEGFGIREARIDKAAEEVERFLITHGFAEGNIESLPEYGEVQPVDKEDVAIFDAACSNYQFPLGTPKFVAKRTTSYSQDYRFDVEGGGDKLWTIFVTVGNEEGAKPEFTLVTR